MYAHICCLLRVRPWSKPLPSAAASALCVEETKVETDCKRRSSNLSNGGLMSFLTSRNKPSCLHMHDFCWHTRHIQALTLKGRHREQLNVRQAAPGNPRLNPQEALRESHQGHGWDFARQAPEEDKQSSCTQGLRKRPNAMLWPRTQFGNPSTTIGSPGPFRAGGQASPL